MAAFGDGVWGQEQERAELIGGGVGFAVRDRFEFSVSGYEPTREETAAGTTGVLGKVRLGDFMGGRASIGIHIARMTSQRERSDVQDERLAAWDIALPLEIYRVGPLGPDYSWGVYVAPRVVAQTFEDRRTRETTEGTLAAALMGVAARWRHFAISGEMNIARTPTMTFGSTTAQGGWIVLPMGSVRGIIPIGD